MNYSPAKFISKYKIRFTLSIKLMILATIVGIIVGIIGVLFYRALTIAINYREMHFPVVFLLPVCGVVVPLMYRIFHNEKDGGTNIVLSSIHSNGSVPHMMAPSIFITTLITQFAGGSAGREGAALQLGGSIGSSIGRVFKLEKSDINIMMMCGMSAAFSVLFGTPIAAAIFSLEVISIGIMHYSALVPCVIASFIARGIADFCSVPREKFDIGAIPAFSIGSSLTVGALAFICAFVSVAFCIMLHYTEHIFKSKISNRYLRGFVGGAIVLGMTLLVGNQTYNGTGFNIVEVCLTGGVVFPLAFLLKMIFTSVTIGCGGFKGGEIVPSFFIGATVGYLFGTLSGFSPMLCTAVGMGAVFCGVTNCPITSILICYELFGGKALPFFVVAIAISNLFSGYYSLYDGQRIVFSKFRPTELNRRANADE